MENISFRSAIIYIGTIFGTNEKTAAMIKAALNSRGIYLRCFDPFKASGLKPLPFQKYLLGKLPGGRARFEEQADTLIKGVDFLSKVRYRIEDLIWDCHMVSHSSRNVMLVGTSYGAALAAYFSGEFRESLAPPTLISPMFPENRSLEPVIDWSRIRKARIFCGTADNEMSKEDVGLVTRLKLGEQTNGLRIQMLQDVGHAFVEPSVQLGPLSLRNPGYNRLVADIVWDRVVEALKKA